MTIPGWMLVTAEATAAVILVALVVEYIRRRK